MRFTPILMAALLELAACQDSSVSSTPSNPSGGIAMRIPAEVVNAANGSADSVVLRVIPLDGVSPMLTKTWRLREGELLFESVPAVACSVKVDLIDLNRAVILQGATMVSVLPGRTTSADISLNLAASGSLSVNLNIDGVDPRFSSPRVSPQAGKYNDSVVVSLSHPSPTALIQFRLEDNSLGSSAEWSRYTTPLTLRQTSRLFVRTINGADTGAISVKDYTISSLKPVLFEGFEIPVGGGIGWDGGTSEATSQRIVDGYWGSASARMDFSASFQRNELFGGYFFGPLFSKPADSLFDKSKVSSIHFKLRTDVARMIKVNVLSSLPGFGSMLSKTIPVSAGASEITVKMSDLRYDPNASGPPVDSALKKLTGFGIYAYCGNAADPGCDDRPGFIELDDIYVDLRD